MANRKQKQDRMFKQMGSKKAVSGNSKRKISRALNAKKPVTRGELSGIQNVLLGRTDTTLMGIAGLVELLVEKKVITWEEFDVKQQTMSKVLAKTRVAMQTVASATRDATNTKDEDVSAAIYEMVKTEEASDEVLDHIFGLRKSTSRIVKPEDVKLIKV